MAKRGNGKGGKMAKRGNGKGGKTRGRIVGDIPPIRQHLRNI